MQVHKLSEFFRYLRRQQRPALPGSDLSVHQVSIRDGVGCLAEQHEVSLHVTTVRRDTGY